MIAYLWDGAVEIASIENVISVVIEPDVTVLRTLTLMIGGPASAEVLRIPRSTPVTVVADSVTIQGGQDA